MATRTANTGANNWNTGAAWVGGVQPTAADDAVIPSGAVVTIPITTTAVCRSIDVQAGGTLAFAATTSVLQVGDASGGALTFSATSTITLTALGTIQLLSTSNNGGLGWPITTGGKIMPICLFNGVGGKWTLQDTFTTGATTTVSLASGTLDTNSKAVSWGLFGTSFATARTLTLGSSVVTLTGVGTPWNASVSTNLTVTANTAVVTMTAASGSFNGGAANWNGMSLVQTAAVGVLTGTNSATTVTLGNYTYNGGAIKTAGVSIAVPYTITGTLTIQGQSIVNRVSVVATIPGIAKLITAAAVVLQFVDFTDITAAGATVPWTGTSLGNGGGNTNITFTAPTTRYWVGGAGTWSDPAHWSATSGGAGGASVPLVHDDVFVNANSGAGAIAQDMPRIGANVDFTGSTISTVNSSASPEIRGSLTLRAGLAFPVNPRLTGRGVHTIDTAGVTVAPTTFTITAVGGTYTLLSNLVVTGTLSLADGTLTVGAFNVTCTIYSQITRTSTLNMGSGTWSITNTLGGTSWSVTAGVAFTLNSETSTIVFSTPSAAARTFGGGGKVYNVLTYTVANSPGALVISGANTFAVLNVGSSRSLTLPSSTITTIGTWNVNGAVNGYQYMPGLTGNFVSTPDSPALNITGDITVDVHLNMVDWTPAGSSALLAKVGSLVAFVDTLGRIRTNVNALGEQISAALGVTNGTDSWLRWSFDANDGAGNRVSRYYLSSDGVTWAIVGAPVSTAGVATMVHTASVWEFASSAGGTNTLLQGRLMRLKMYAADLQTAAGTAVFDVDLTTKPFGANSLIESSPNAALVTINGVVAQQGDGRITVQSSVPGTPATLAKLAPDATGTMEYVATSRLVIQDVAATGLARWWAGPTSVNVSGNSGWGFDAIQPVKSSVFA